LARAVQKVREIKIAIPADKAFWMTDLLTTRPGGSTVWSRMTHSGHEE
jgi:hypothetical protein